MVRAKKFLGQHFLHDRQIAMKIVAALKRKGQGMSVLEIGPGTGVLTGLLLQDDQLELTVIEVDHESVEYLRVHFPQLENRILSGDFLKMNLADHFSGPLSVIGNFPYNISSQIFFNLLNYKDQVCQVVCMLQKEVADRIAAPHGNKTYGILSVLLQTYYDIEFLFKVSPGVFTPPPKVMSGVIRLTRNQRTHLACNEKLFGQVVKQGFNNRRKTLRNALKPLNLPVEITSLALLDKRAEQLPVEEFIHLTKLIENNRAAN